MGAKQMLPANGRIELGFDRLLQPASITRQTFSLQSPGGEIVYTPNVAYDPVARIVTITPLTTAGQALVSGQSYEIIIAAPQNAADVNGVRAIDGATIAKGSLQIAFSVSAASPTPPPTVTIDFCNDISPIIGFKCALPTCHGGNTPAEGLVLDPFSGIAMTAIGRVSQESNTGPRSLASPPTLLFGEDMPIIDATGATGDPANSWLMYKVLLAAPTPEPADAGTEDAAPGAADTGAPDATVGATDAGTPDATVGITDAGPETDGASPEGGELDAGADGESSDGAVAAAPTMPPPTDVSGAHSLTWKGISDAERATLSNYILGREMPFPPPSGTPLQDTNDPLTLDELERMSLWIAQGAPTPSCP